MAVKHYQDNTWSGILVDFLYYNLLFCEGKGLTPEKTSAFFSIMKRVFEYTFRPELEPGNVDESEARVSMEASFAFFKAQMLSHSVEAPEERSVGLFSVGDVEVIAEFISTTFYRHFKAYSYTFYNKQPDENVERFLMVEQPLAPPALRMGTPESEEANDDPAATGPSPAPEGTATACDEDAGQAPDESATADNAHPAE